MGRPERLPVAEFGFPGPLRDRLVAAILTGLKTTTAGLLEEYRREGASLPEPGERALVVDSAGRGVAVIETVDVAVLCLDDVDLPFALEEVERLAG